MARTSLFLRTLKCALGIVGSEHRLARRLRVPQDDLHAWLAGEEVPPTWVFLSAVDVVVGAGDPRVVNVPYERRRTPRHQQIADRV